MQTSEFPTSDHVTEVGSDSVIKAASWSCSCGDSEVITYARPGMGEVVALRLARIKAAKHEGRDFATGGTIEAPAQDGGESRDDS